MTHFCVTGQAVLHCTVIDVGSTSETEHENANIDSHIVLQVVVGNAVPTLAIASDTQLLASLIGPPAQICGTGA